MTLISFISALTPFIFIGYWYYLQKRRENISFDIRFGLRCYSCKEKNGFDISSRFVNNDIVEKLEICKSCEREERLNILFKRRLNINRIKRFLISNKSRKVQGILLVMIVSCVVIDITMLFTIKVRGFGLLSNLISIVFWVCFIGRFIVTSIKKPK